MSASLFKYRDAFYKSQKFFNYLKLESFPVDLFQIFLKAKRRPILVVSLDEYNQGHIPLKIKDAKCFYYPERAYLIVYNNQKPATRIRFSLAHELGHIVLGHLNDARTELERGGLDDVTYHILEGEANTFAGNFLAPPILIHERAKEQNDSITASTVSRLFKISVLAAERRLIDFKEWHSVRVSPHELNIRRKYGVYTHPRYCNKCKCLFYGAKTKYCPICGNGKLSNFKGEPEMKYSGIETDENGRMIQCPVCENEEFLSDSDYCHICGIIAVNRCEHMFFTDGAPHEYCVGHDKPIPGNARYCPYCGNKTTFFEAGLLKPWNNKELEIIEEDDLLPF